MWQRQWLVSCTVHQSLVNIVLLLNVLWVRVFFRAFLSLIHDHKPLLRAVHYCVLSIISKMYLQPQPNTANPLKVFCRFCGLGLLPFLHISPIAGIGGAAAGICPPRRSLPCIIPGIWCISIKKKMGNCWYHFKWYVMWCDVIYHEYHVIGLWLLFLYILYRWMLWLMI